MKRFLTIIFSILFFCIQTLAFTVVIDPGHGGRDVGALGRVSKEKDINLKVALALGNLIKKNYPGIKVVYTRSKDTFVELGRRAAIANKAKADLFISIHTNSTAAGRKGTTAQGTETFTLGMHRVADNLAVAKRENSVITLETNYEQTYEGFDPSSSESYIIFELMQDQYMASSVDFASMVQKQFATTAKRVNKGVHQAGFLVLREVSMPSVLIELGFINNRQEEKFLASEWGQKQLAKSIYNAFQAYYKKSK
ncbi:MAG: N-acetylmuramoyl-L-alanine amidase [Bacteroidaceae bacterium]|nr:N-acetylmuramoyl-L-alanine amidase [Bacteroidaceae bacterium]